MTQDALYMATTDDGNSGRPRVKVPLHCVGGA